MPITGIYSYLSTADDFETQWSNVNAARPSNPIVLPDGTTLVMFKAMNVALKASFVAVSDAATDERTASGNLLMRRQAIQPRIVQFGGTVRLYLGQSQFARVAPDSPALLAGRPVYERAGEAIIKAWTDIDAATGIPHFTAPLLMPDLTDDTANDYDITTFEAHFAQLMAAFGADHDAAMAATQVRANRNALMPKIYKAMKDYRATALLALAKDNPLRATIPRLTPAPGTTPPAVVLSGDWNNAILKAFLSWALAQGSDLSKLQLRGCTGGTYKADEEEIIADLPVTATDYTFDWGLTAPGAMIAVKLYVMNTHGNENGGKALRIVRPFT